MEQLLERIVGFADKGLPPSIHFILTIASLSLYAIVIHVNSKRERVSRQWRLLPPDLSWKSFVFWMGFLSFFLCQLWFVHSRKGELIIIIFYVSLPLVLWKEFKKGQGSSRLDDSPEGLDSSGQ